MQPAHSRFLESLRRASPGASLKLSILNPAGRIWTMVAGGGASVIYADTVGDLGLAQELGNYAEYSGAPNAAETYAYAKTLLDWCAVVLHDRAPHSGGGVDATIIACELGTLHVMAAVLPHLAEHYAQHFWWLF